MELILHEGWGYFYDEITKSMDQEEWKLFEKFIEGQTMALIDDRKVVYKGDYDRFKAGLPVID